MYQPLRKLDQLMIKTTHLTSNDWQPRKHKPKRWSSSGWTRRCRISTILSRSGSSRKESRRALRLNYNICSSKRKMTNKRRRRSETVCTWSSKSLRSTRWGNLRWSTLVSCLRMINGSFAGCSTTMTSSITRKKKSKMKSRANVPGFER